MRCAVALAFAVTVVVGACGGSPATPDASPPVGSGCIADATSGDLAFMCGGLEVDARVPPACLAPGCGLVLVLHGDTGNGPLMDAHVRLRELGAVHDYIVVAPTGPLLLGGYQGSTWRATNDATLIDIVEQFAAVYRVDPKKVHVTGFSRGSFVTWRLLCDHSELFASVAPAGGGHGDGFGEVTCFTAGREPSRPRPILFLMGRTDTSVGYATLVSIRDAAIATYGAAGPTMIAGDAAYRHERWTGAAVIETFDHAYETVNDGPWANVRGHCIPGSMMDPYASQYAIPCVLPNAFTWGEQIMAFFRAHPAP